MPTHDQDPAEYPMLYPADDPTRTTSPRQAMIDPLSPPESHVGDDEVPQADVFDFAAYMPESLTFRRILVPLDGSVRAEQAIPLTARIAQASRASMLLVQVVSPPISGPGLAPVAATIEPLLDAASEYLKTMARREELVDVEVHRKVLTGVSAAPTLLEAIELYQCDLAVICSHGRSGLTRWALGSVAQKMAQHASVPVLVLRPDGGLTPAPRPGQGPAVRALVPLDGSPTAEAALLPAARLVAALAGPGHGALHLLRVLDLSTVGSGAATPVLPYRAAGEAALEDARTYLHAVAHRLGEGELAKLGLRVTWSALDDADAACGILDEAEGDGADAETKSRDKPRYDLIAMATHGRTGLRLWALGSVTDRVLQTTRLPLLIVRPSQAAG